jgi:hypothetical protein
MTKQRIYLQLSIILFLLLIVQITLAQNQISVKVISSGGEKLSSATYILNSTVGEPFIGKSVNTLNQQTSGFWYAYKQSTLTKVIKDEKTNPIIFKLEQNYPNPFNPSTVIKFAVPERSYVLIKIYDILGGEVITLVNEVLEEGWYTREFNALRYSSGIYICRMRAGTYICTKKMMLVK